MVDYDDEITDALIATHIIVIVIGVLTVLVMFL